MVEKYTEKIPKICLVSSAAFNALTCVCPYTAPIGAALGLYASIKAEERQTLAEEYTKATVAALKKTREDLTTKDSIKILDELSSMDVRPDNIDNLILKTETYRSSYCTQLDRKRIIDIFEVYFKEEVCKCSKLSNQYLLTAGALTLEKIKSINDALVAQDRSLTIIKDGVDDINRKTDKILSVAKTILGECGFILTAVASCLLTASIFNVGYSSFYLDVIMCYLFATILSYGILKSVWMPSKKIQSSEYVFSLSIATFIYTAISVGAYLVIVSSRSLKTASNEIVCVAIGGVIHQILKATYEAHNVRTSNHSKDLALTPDKTKM